MKKSLVAALLTATLALPNTGFAQDITSQIQHALSDVAEQSLPSVVTILSSRNVLHGFRGDPLLEHFFGRRGRQQEFKQQGLGSGVIVRADGLILTNHHVIAEADDLKVRLHNGDEYEATIVGSDPRTDVAVVRIQKKGLRAAPIGDSDSLRIAELILCIGSPLSENLGHTVTRGIVSAMGRSNVGLADYENFIQTDAAINPGNSGGPMLNLQGEVVGINTAIASRTGGFQGVGFAVPSNMARKVMEQLIEDGRVTRGWLGILIQDVNDALAEAMDLPQAKGVLITEVVSGAPAEAAGLKAGDVIVALNDSPVNRVAELRNNVAQTSPGTRVNVRFIRDGAKTDLTIRIGELPSDSAKGSGKNSPAQKPRSIERLGLSLEPLTRAVRRRLSLDKRVQGIRVYDIKRGGLGDRLGLLEGDIIQEINRKPVKTLRQVEQALGPMKSGASLLLRVRRGGGPIFLALRIP